MSLDFISAGERIALYRSRHTIKAALGGNIARCETDGIRLHAIRGGLRHDKREIRDLAAQALRDESAARVAPKVIPAGTADWGPVGESDAGVAPNLGIDREALRQVFHDENTWDNPRWGCTHRNQHPGSWECEKRVRYIERAIRDTAARPKVEAPELA